jgi:hypothetical protein
MTTWTISTLERELSDGGVVVAHWRATAVDGEHSASSYGTCGFTPDPSDPSFVAYDSITEDMALGWCWANGVDKDATEASLAAKIEADKNPTQGVGVPW